MFRVRFVSVREGQNSVFLRSDTEEMSLVVELVIQLLAIRAYKVKMLSHVLA